MKKGFIIGFVTGLTVAGASLVLANSQIQAILNDQIKVTLNGQVQEFKDETTNETQYPITYHDRTYLPLRTVANLFGVDVGYDQKSNTAILTKELNEIAESKDVRYRKYLDNYKENLMEKLSARKDKYKEEIAVIEDGYATVSFSADALCGIIDENNQYIANEKRIYLTLNDKLDFLINGEKICDNVLKVYALYEGNGAPGVSIYFIRDDGTLNYLGYGKSVYDGKNSEIVIQEIGLKYIVDFIEISHVDGTNVSFVDIDGNIYSW